MRINRIETKAYSVSKKAEASALKYFKKKTKHVEKISKTKVSSEINYHYTPLAVLSAVKYDRDRQGVLIEGLENDFHIGLRDACFYVFNKKTKGQKTREKIIKPAQVGIKRIDLLLDVATLSPRALSTLGYLLDHGTTYYDELDVPKQEAARELLGRKYAEIYREVDKESDITKVFREIIEMEPVTPLYKVRPHLPTPRFMDTTYNLSRKLSLTDKVEDEVELEKIAFAPEKLIYILGTLFNCSLKVNRIIYLPYVECTYRWADKQSTEIKYIPCFKNTKPKTLTNPVKLKTITVGTKGHGLNAIPFEDVAINFTNVAGMSEVKEEIKESIIYPLAHPELSKEFGSKGGGGVLFYGPPGCGKSYIMRAAVGEAGVNFFAVSVQDIIGNDLDTASTQLDQAFSEARASSPSILFFDEIDGLGGARTSKQSGSEHRLVNQFLTNMEGVGQSNENVLVVGATNTPWAMDPAMRRAGRFTTQIFIPPPDYEARTELVKIHTKGRPLSKNIDLKKLAELTENYSSADITAVCDEAAKMPWRESVHGGEKRTINMQDFQKVLDQRESTLKPWLRIAEKQLRDSGEADVFPELADYVFKRAGGIEMTAQPKINFADVGGLEEIKEEIKTKVVYPLRHPELSGEYGRKVGGGLMLYGPPGCGKTYIARATAGECDASFFNVKITDLISPEEGVTEKRLHSIFERASRNTPAIIFFDEIDALAGYRSSAEGGTERRLVNQFLTEMDGFEEKEGIVVLAATNAPWDVDPALRRAGRFTDQLFLPPPDRESRESIFEIHLGERPITSDIDLKKISELTQDYSSADIKVICDEASKIPWKESMESGQKRPISIRDFKKVISERSPSITAWLKQAEKQLRESGEADVYTELADYVLKRAGGVAAVVKPDLNYDNVADMDEAKEKLRKMIVHPLTNPKLAEKYGRGVGGGILLYGPPGCGKTFIARATAGECEASFFNIKITDVLSHQAGESERKLSAIFERASRNTPAIVFFDEIDALATRRGAAGDSKTLVNQFLTEMDGFTKREGVVIVAATNAPWDVDPAMRRAGRFTNQIYVSAPDETARELVFRLHAKGKPVDEKIDYKKLALKTDGFSPADIKAIVDEAIEIPWAEALSDGKERPAVMKDFNAVLKKRPSSLKPWYNIAREQIEKSGEREFYPELSKSLGIEVSENQRGPDKPSGLDYDIRETREQITILKSKRESGEVDDETYHELIKDLEKTLIKLEAKQND